MLWLFRLMLVSLLPRFGHRRDLALEVLALRQQNAVLLRRSQRVRLKRWDRLFWIALSRLWAGWKSSCLVVKPATVVAWHRASFRVFWRWRSRHQRKPGRPTVATEVHTLIRRMAQENPNWGAPRIHGELLKLGFRISERTVQNRMPKRPTSPLQRQNWKQFLSNHREWIAAMDFMVVPTATFGLLYVLVIVDHGRRMVRHFQVTAHPTAEWLKAQLREAFPFDEVPRYLIYDRDTTFGAAKGFVKSLGIEPKVTAFRSPWQNGVCERLIGTLRRDLLDHVIVLNEAHLRRLIREYLAYYHADRTHLGLGKDSPFGRQPRARPSPNATIRCEPKSGGLHHRYDWDEAA